MSNYINWLIGDCGCGCKNDYKKVDNCDCDTINLNISNLKTDVNTLQQEIDDIDINPEDYYTKLEVDALIPTNVSELANDAGYITNAALVDYATKQWVENKNYLTDADLSDYALKSDIPTNVSAFNNDAGYLTEHTPLKTINGQVISGSGNIVIEGSGGTVDVDSVLSSTSTNPVENKAIVEALNGLNERKLDASAYTPTDLSNYYTKSEVDAKDGVLEDRIYEFEYDMVSDFDNLEYIKQDKLTAGDNISIVNNVISATIPTNVSSFTNDAHYVTSGDSVFNNYATTANTYTKTEVDNLISNKIICLTQAQYDALATKAPDTLYLIYEV